MKAGVLMMGCAALLLTACDDFASATATSGPNSGFISQVPEEVAAMAAKNQDLSAVRIDPADGCYVYRYAGPVETTFLPLRTVNGAPICTRTADAAAS